ncbi:hypothetical protein ACFL6C_05840 [Myxococcota bacterium]
MKAAWIALVVVLLTGCSRCGESQGDNNNPRGEAVSADVPIADVPLPGAIYKDAFEKARREINNDNVRVRLEELEREVERDAEAL